MNRLEAKTELNKIYMGLSPTNQKALDICFNTINLVEGKNKKENFAENLKKLIKSKGYTIVKFADKCGLSYGTVTNYIRGYATPSIPNLIKIAQLLEVNIEELIFEIN